MDAKIIITEAYLALWDDMFNRLKEYKKQFGKTTVSRTHHDKALYTWFRKQKALYNHSNLKMPEEHFKKLKSIDFYFGDGHKEQEAIVEKKWLDLLEEALKNGEDVKANHRYRYKGQGLGTFLVGISKKNKEGKRLETKWKIEQIGFDYYKTVRTPKATAERFLNALLTKENKPKFKFQTYFNRLILEKKDVLSPEIIEKINKAWMMRFNEKRTWKKIRRTKTPREIANRFIKDFTNNSLENKEKYEARFRHAILPRRSSFSSDIKAKVVKAWKKKYKEVLDWDMEVQRRTPNNTVKQLIYDLMTRPTYPKQRFRRRFFASIRSHREDISQKLIEELNKTWKWRFEEDLDWEEKLISLKPEDVLNRFLTNLKEDVSPKRHYFRIRFFRFILPKKDILSDSLINEINQAWERAFKEELLWEFPIKKELAKESKRKANEKQRIKEWRKYRNNKTLNPKGKWQTGPKDMGNLYSWTSRLKHNKYAFARLVKYFKEEEIKELQNEGFNIDLNIKI